MLRDLRRELDPFTLQLLDGRLKLRLRLEGYDGTTTRLRAPRLPAVEPDV